MREINIAGMTPETYDADSDPRGDIGLALADAMYRQRKEGALIEKELAGNSRDYWAGVVRVALQRFPELQRGETISDKEIRQRLRDIRKAGYDVPADSRMSKDEKWNLLMMVRRDVANKAREHCPDVLDEVNRKNEQAKHEAYWLS